MPHRPFFIKESYVMPLSILISTVLLVVFSMAVSGAFDSRRDSILDQAIFLGTWQVISDKGQSGSANIPARQRWGFADDGSSLVMRVYGNEGKTLEEINAWSVEYDGDAPVLNTYFWDEGPLSGDGSAKESYKLEAYDEKSIVLSHVISPGLESGIEKILLTRTGSASEELRRDLVLTEPQHEDVCKRTLSGDYMTDSNESRVILPLSCVGDIGKGARAVFTFLPGGSIEVRADSKLINTLASEETDYSGPFLLNSFFELKDYTFDGYADIALLASRGAYNFTYEYYAFNPYDGKFATEPMLTLTNPSQDAAKRLLTSFAKGRGLGDMYVEETYEFKDSAYVLIRREKQDMIEGSEGEPATYERVIEELRDGALAETERRVLSEKDLGM